VGRHNDPHDFDRYPNWRILGMSSHKPDDIAYRYLAKNGEEIAGVPTADITYEMLDAMTPLALRNLNHSPLYEPVTTGVPRLQQDSSEEPPVAPDSKAPKGDKE
jgi:hypothetical protein